MSRHGMRGGAVTKALLEPESSPLRGVLEEAPDEERALRMWRGVERRLHRSPTFRTRSAWALVATLGLSLSVCFSWWIFLPGPVPGELKAASGASLNVFEGAKASPPIALEDGSRLILQEGSRLEVLRNDGGSFVTVLRRGTGTFDVRPGGPRRWVLQAGPATVEVLGTLFRVARAEGSVKVSVERGVVMVRGETLPNGAQRLVAGQSVEVREAVPAREAVVPSSKAAPDPVDSAPRASASSSARSTPAAASSGEIDREDAIDTLLAAADAARQRGDPELAIARFEEVLQRASREDPRAGMAALSIARLTLEHDPERALRALSSAGKSMPKGLSEDALVRNIEALSRAGRREEARVLAREYRSLFPNGPRTQDVERWIAP